MSLKEVNMVPSAQALRIGIAAPHQCVGRGREEKMGRNVEAMLGDEPFIKAPNFRRITLIENGRPSSGDPTRSVKFTPVL